MYYVIGVSVPSLHSLPNRMCTALMQTNTLPLCEVYLFNSMLNHSCNTFTPFISNPSTLCRHLKGQYVLPQLE